MLPLVLSSCWMVQGDAFRSLHATALTETASRSRPALTSHQRLYQTISDATLQVHCRVLPTRSNGLLRGRGVLRLMRLSLRLAGDASTSTVQIIRMLSISGTAAMVPMRMSNSYGMQQVVVSSHWIRTRSVGVSAIASHQRINFLGNPDAPTQCLLLLQCHWQWHEGLHKCSLGDRRAARITANVLHLDTTESYNSTASAN